MSDREYAKTLIDRIPEDKMANVVNILLNVSEIFGLETEIPNDETLEAMAELSSGGGHPFHGSTEELFRELMEE
jgi:hypothetical protein